MLKMPKNQSNFVYFDIDEFQTGDLQLSINVDANDIGYGYRLAGPKFDGTSKNVLRHKLTVRDINEIREYLDLAEKYMNTTKKKVKTK